MVILMILYGSVELPEDNFQVALVIISPKYQALVLESCPLLYAHLWLPALGRRLFISAPGHMK